jgi:hypothetical protein
MPQTRRDRRSGVGATAVVPFQSWVVRGAAASRRLSTGAGVHRARRRVLRVGSRPTQRPLVWPEPPPRGLVADVEAPFLRVRQISTSCVVTRRRRPRSEGRLGQQALLTTKGLHHMNSTQQLMLAAFAGAMLGATACAGNPTSAQSPSSAAASGDMVASGDKHSCKGQNECKGRGGCKTEQNACRGQNECKGRGGCSSLAATAPSDSDMGTPSGAKHACKGQNECKGQGGCKTEHNACRGQNECKGRGGCQMT